MGYSFYKLVSLNNGQKGFKNDCTATLDLFGAKNRSKKHLILVVIFEGDHALIYLYIFAVVLLLGNLLHCIS